MGRNQHSSSHSITHKNVSFVKSQECSFLMKRAEIYSWWNRYFLWIIGDLDVLFLASISHTVVGLLDVLEAVLLLWIFTSRCFWLKQSFHSEGRRNTILRSSTVRHLGDAAFTRWRLSFMQDIVYMCVCTHAYVAKEIWPRLQTKNILCWQCNAQVWGIMYGHFKSLEH